jgi:mRNA-degrading endonuclease RelE of RelBE toxin-antitoxin system
LWAFEKKNKFKKQFKSLSPALKDKVKSALIDLATSEDPRTLGVFKPSMKIYAYELNKSYRILYSVRFEEKVIELIRVGDHKGVYGHD